MNVHLQEWTDEDLRAIQDATTLDSMADIACAIVLRMPSGLHFVSGPISTGGFGDVAKNRDILRAAIEELSRQGHPIWSQMPFEDKLVWFDAQWRKDGKSTGYCWPILETFYESIFSTGRFQVGHFLHGFESSIGARWEHENCGRWNISRRRLEPSFSRGLLEVAACASGR